MDSNKFIDRVMTFPAISGILAVLVYINILGNGFVYDDHFVITDNPWMKDPGSILTILFSSEWSFLPGSPTVNYYRPTFHLLNMVSYQLFGPNPWGFHLVSIIIHAANTVLVVLVAERLVSLDRGADAMDATRKGMRYVPLIAGLLFATHPVHVESIAWISAVADLIYSLFVLLSFYTYIVSRDTGRPTFSVIISPTFFFLGLISKETAVALPIFIVLYELVARKEPLIPITPWIKRLLPYALVFAGYIVLRLYALGGFAPETEKYTTLTPYQGFINVLLLVPLYIGKLLWPATLNIYHTLIPLESLAEPRTILSIIFLLALLAFFIILLKKNRLAAFLLLWIGVPLAPALYIPGLGREMFAERYLYLPSAGFVMAAGLLVGSFTSKAAVTKAGWARNHVTLAIIILVVTAGYSFVTIKRTFDWRNDYAIWHDALTKSPDVGYVHLSLAIAALGERRPQEAVERFQKALSLDLLEEDRWRGYYNLGNARLRLEQYDKAVLAFKNALGIKPQNYETIFNLGIAHEKNGRLLDALETFKKALEKKPGDASSLKSIGRLHRKMGDFNASANYYRKAIEADSTDTDAINNLGALYAILGEYEKATEMFRAVLDLDPNNPEALANIKKLEKILNSR